MSAAMTLILVAIVAFFALREVMCWYYKINKMIELQKQQTMILFKIYEQRGGEVNWDEINKMML